MEITERTIPTPGNMNLEAIRPNSNGEDVCDSRTFRANRKVMEETTVRMTWDHQDSQVEVVSFCEARRTRSLLLDCWGMDESG
jgi:hypothetical protein